MLISLNEIKKLVDIKISDEELLKLIGSRLVEVESVSDWSQKYKKIYVVKVLECEEIEGTHLHLCKIDAGEKLNSEIDSEHENYIQVVCGAPNVRTGMFAAWIAPRAIVPLTADTSEPFEISARKLRGFMSFGMLAGADELALGDDHSGIIELSPDLAEPGTLLADALDLNDKIIEVENKSLTHRPDCFGLIGFAREVAGILGQKFSPSEKIQNLLSENLLDSLELSNNQKPSIKIEDSKICPRYEALVFEFKKLPESSPYLTEDGVFLFKAGMKPISPIVDATNIIMLTTGQPLHAFDYDKFISVGSSKTPEIGVRLAREGEKLILLNDEEAALNRNDIIITSNDTPVALAGAMGGKSTEIDGNTQKIIIEIASFSLYNLRKTQMAHGLFSEAITRFTKGRPASDLLPAINDSLYYFHDLLKGTLLGFNEKSSDSSLPTVSVTIQDINNLLGSSYSKELVIKTLENVGFKVSSSASDMLKVETPYWRTDIHIKEDIIEEIGRLLGYDNLPLNYPLRPLVCASVDPLLKLKSKIRTILSDHIGANEILTYSFVSRKLQEKANEDTDNSYKIINSISPKLECFRQSLLPSLLEKTYENQKAGYKDFALYELNQVTGKTLGLTEESVPTLKTALGLVTFGDFYKAKHILAELEKSLHIPFILSPVNDAAELKNTPFEPLRTIKISLNNPEKTPLGFLGEIDYSVQKAFKISEVCSALQIYLDPCISAAKTQKTMIKLSRFPSVSRDLTFSVQETVPYETVKTEIVNTLSKNSDLIFTLTPLSIYKKPGSSTKNISFHLVLSDKNKTLMSEEISVIIESIIVRLSETTDAKIV